MKQKNSKEKGITLIALVITIIVLLILAGVTINIAVNSGIMDKSEKAVSKYTEQEVKEKLLLAILDYKMGILSGDNKTLEDYINEIGGTIKHNEEEGEYDITIDGYEFKVDDETLEITDINKGTSEPYPEITLEQIAMEGTENEKVKIKVIAKVEKKLNTTKVSTIELVTTGETKEYDEENGVIFEVDGNGTYVFKATTDQGKSTTKTIIIDIQKIDNKIDIDIEPKTARNTLKTETQNGIETGPIKVTINYGETELKKLYSTDGEKWKEVTGTSTEIDVKENISIVAKYSDGINAFNAETYNIQNVDNVAPTFSSYDAILNGTTITAIGDATDEASEGAAESTSGISGYAYSIGGTSYQESNTFTINSAGTYTVYIKAIDKAGNETIVNKSVTGYTLSRTAETGGTVSGDSGIKASGQSCEVTASANTGYSFSGWYNGSTKVSSDATYTFDMPASNYSLTAKFTAINYTLSITAETGGTVSGDSGTKTYGQSCTVTASANTGYSFSGWYNGSTKVSSNASYTFSMPASNYSLTAKFTAINYTLTITAETGGTVSGDSGTKTYGQSCTVTATASTGYSFSGWYNGSTKVSSNASYTFNMPASNYSLTAKFTINSYTVTCIDKVDSTSGTTLGTSTWKANYGTTASGSTKGTSNTVGAYYTDYAYVSSTSTTVTGNVTVYRIFKYGVITFSNGTKVYCSSSDLMSDFSVPSGATVYVSGYCAQLQSQVKNTLYGWIHYLNDSGSVQHACEVYGSTSSATTDSDSYQFSEQTECSLKTNPMDLLATSTGSYVQITKIVDSTGFTYTLR